MQINLRPLREAPGTVLPFDFNIDLSELESCARNPIRVHGALSNHAGMIRLDMEIDTVLHLTCDRCCKEFEREKHLCFDAMIAESTQSDDIDGILLSDGDILDLYEISYTEFLLGLDSKILCKQDCLGLCQKCGADLNMSPCACQNSEPDIRLAKLNELLK